MEYTHSNVVKQKRVRTCTLCFNIPRIYNDTMTDVATYVTAGAGALCCAPLTSQARFL